MTLNDIDQICPLTFMYFVIESQISGNKQFYVIFNAEFEFAGQEHPLATIARNIDTL